MQIVAKAKLSSLQSGFVVDEVMFARLTKHMAEAIDESLLSFPPRGSIEMALRERFNKLEAWVLILRHEFKWSIPRIVDHLGQVLRAELSGTKFDPTKVDHAGMWVGRAQ